MFRPAIAKSRHRPSIPRQFIDAQPLLPTQNTDPPLQGMGQGSIGLLRLRFEVVELELQPHKGLQHRHPAGKHASGGEISPQHGHPRQAGAPLQRLEVLTVVLQLQTDRHLGARRCQQTQLRILLQPLIQPLQQRWFQQGVQQVIPPVLAIGEMR